MVKPDPQRNYYADLGLPDSADITEIKKQYKKLALKWHPDRNPGQEETVTAKFQTISEAHEILTDPASKAKYDASRSRLKYPVASGVRGNPWQDVGHQYPAPPSRRPDMPRRNHPTARERYQNVFNREPGFRTTPDDDKPEDTHRDKYEAYNKMRGSRANKPRAGPNPPKSPSASPRTRAQKEKANASFAKFSKKGFNLNDPASDEKPVSSKNYSTGRHTNLFEDATANAWKTREAEAEAEAEAEQYNTDEDIDDNPFDRQSTPYGGPRGEKFNPHEGTNLHRDNSTQEPPRPMENGDSQPTPHRRRRSSSVPNVEETPGFRQTPNASHGSNTTSNGSATNLGGQFPSETSTNGPYHDRSHGQSNNSAKNTTGFMSDSTSRPSQPFSASSAENINTNFAQTEKPQKFSAGDGVPSSATKHRASSGGRSGRRSPLKKARPPPGTERYTSGYDQKPEATPKSGFNPDDWAQKIDAKSFAPLPTKTPSASPTRRAPSKKTRRPVTVEDEPEATPSTPTPQVAANSPVAMDIDSPPVEESPTNAGNAARNINVEPSRPEWRPGDVNGIKKDFASATPQEGTGLKASSNLGSEDTDNLRANLSEFRNIEPFNVPSTGLNSFSDMKSKLPFQSRPSARIPLDREHQLSAKPPLTDVPLPPEHPSSWFDPEQKITIATFRSYAASFEVYMTEFEIWNGYMLNYFTTTRRDLRTKGQLNHDGKRPFPWVSAMGDSGMHEIYATALLENKEARLKWMGACEQHDQAYSNFLSFRDRAVAA